jgi:hypothetical protein
MCVVSLFWGKYFPIKDPARNWAQCRHHYFTAKSTAAQVSSALIKPLNSASAFL